MKRLLAAALVCACCALSVPSAMADTQRAKDDADFAEAQAREAKARADKAEHEAREAKARAEKAEAERREAEAKNTPPRAATGPQ